MWSGVLKMREVETVPNFVPTSNPDLLRLITLKGS
jgi:hypothetical protein